MRLSRFYKHGERGYFHKKRWPLIDFNSIKISNLHQAFHHTPRRGYLAMAGWNGKTGNGTMSVYDVGGRRLVQVRKIVGGYIREIHRGRYAEEFDTVWWHKELDGRVAESG